MHVADTLNFLKSSSSSTSKTKQLADQNIVEMNKWIEEHKWAKLKLRTRQMVPPEDVYKARKVDKEKAEELADDFLRLDSKPTITCVGFIEKSKNRLLPDRSRLGAETQLTPSDLKKVGLDSPDTKWYAVCGGHNRYAWNFLHEKFPRNPVFPWATVNIIIANRDLDSFEYLFEYGNIDNVKAHNVHKMSFLDQMLSIRSKFEMAESYFKSHEKLGKKSLNSWLARMKSKWRSSMQMNPNSFGAMWTFVSKNNHVWPLKLAMFTGEGMHKNFKPAQSMHCFTVMGSIPPYMVKTLFESVNKLKWQPKDFRKACIKYKNKVKVDNAIREAINQSILAKSDNDSREPDLYQTVLEAKEDYPTATSDNFRHTWTEMLCGHKSMKSDALPASFTIELLKRIAADAFKLQVAAEHDLVVAQQRKVCCAFDYSFDWVIVLVTFFSFVSFMY